MTKGPTTMWAQTLVAPYTFQETETDEPDAAALAPGQVIVEMLAGSICGSDLPSFAGQASPVPASGGISGTGVRGQGLPGYPMHEIVGTVVASRSDLEVGERVVGWATASSGIAEKVLTEASSLTRVDDSLTAVEATIIQPLACVLYALDRVGPIEGRTAGVIGQGPLGMLFSHVLGARGATKVVGVDRIDRRDVAQAFHVDETVTADSGRWSDGLADADRLDLVVESIGHQTATLNHAIEAAAPGGTVFYFGIANEAVYPVKIWRLQRSNLTLTAGVTPKGPGRRKALDDAREYVAKHPGLPGRYITHVFPARQAQEAYTCASTPAAGRLKVALTWG